ncbi:hypothetical protein [Ruminococcus sp.]|uniref:hypothetical protein n=1 Tax=Ruminococcus sp. TaxID=41978 RepID=UPI0025851D72|nr:hypothetical protein [Ruminococcus sp.]MCR5021424.1 hypothetical protein [Ruminococcus sp.]
MRDRKLDKACAISALAVMPFVMLLFIAESVVKVKFAPQTLIGADGLLQMKKYCVTLIEYHAAGAVFIFILTMLAAWLFRKLSGSKNNSRRKSVIAAVLLAVGWLLLFPMFTGCDVQAESAGCKGVPIFRVADLLTKLNADIDSEEVEIVYTGKPMFANYSYRYSRNQWPENEYAFVTLSKKTIGQISHEDMKKLNNGIYRYADHEFKVYSNSRIIANIDGVGNVDDISQEVITLEFDPETSMIYRDLICDDESELPMMYYVCRDRENGRFVGDSPANNDTDCYVSSAYNGNLEIWIEARDLVCDKTVRVSNVITCEHTEHIEE